MLSASRLDDKIAWYENDGSGGFGPQQTISTSAYGAMSVYAADLDEDGRLDVLAASSSPTEPDIIWYPQEVGSFGEIGFSPAIRISNKVDRAQKVLAGDLDGDGDQDVLSASSGDDKIAWYENTETTLPVELISFSATGAKSNVHLEWRTASETSNAGFYVERRKGESEDWAEIGFVEGVGTTTDTQGYTFTDASFSEDTSILFYRLRQVDLDGTVEYSPEVEVSLVVSNGVALKANYPNPFRKSTVVRYALPADMPVQLDVYDIRGRHVATLIDEVQSAGTKAITWTPEDLASGVYLLRLEANGLTRTKKLNLVR